VIRGTLAQVNAYLADLQVSMTGSGVENADKAWHVEVIADDPYARSHHWGAA
jgi:hypothetical protein